MVKILVQRDSLNKRTYVLDKTNGLCYTTEEVDKVPTVFTILLSMFSTATLFVTFSLFVVYNVSIYVFFMECIFIGISTFIISNIEKRNFLNRCFLCEVIKGADNLKKDMKIKRNCAISNFIVIFIMLSFCMYYVSLVSCTKLNRIACFLFLLPMSRMVGKYFDRCLYVKMRNFIQEEILVEREASSA